MVQSIKHNSAEAPAPSCEKVCPKCEKWTATQQVLYYSILSRRFSDSECF